MPVVPRVLVVELLLVSLFMCGVLSGGQEIAGGPASRFQCRKLGVPDLSVDVPQPV
jgi:hypothetical protein